MRLCETHNDLQLPVFFFFSFFVFFCQPCPGIRNWESVFLILKTLNMVDRGGEFSFLRAIHIINWYKNWYLHFHNTYGHQIWQAGTSRGVDSHETKEAGSGDVITSRSRDKEKHYISTTRVLISTKHGLMIT